MRDAFDKPFDALMDTLEEAANMTLRSDLMRAIRKEVQGWAEPQTAAVACLGVSQPRLNDLLLGRINKFSLDDLVTWRPAPVSTLGPQRRRELADTTRTIKAVKPTGEARLLALNGGLLLKPGEPAPKTVLQARKRVESRAWRQNSRLLAQLQRDIASQRTLALSRTRDSRPNRR
jgi:predicted XRE-type DNA-binding protein